ncbi:BTB/POZ domain-containing protein [Trifolium repens]|jgi:hypothetical protein|nr:BTB/POZ domain-containing protein [Trifolium repens]
MLGLLEPLLINPAEVGEFCAKSLVFQKLFINGMKESFQDTVTLHIEALRPFLELINFLRTDVSNLNTEEDLINLLVVADQFLVASCVSFCVQALLDHFPLTVEKALFYLDIPLLSADIKPLKDASQNHLVEMFNPFTKNKNKREVIDMPLYGIKSMLESDDLIVKSEDEIYDFVHEWIGHQHLSPREKEQIMCELTPCIRFKYLSLRKMKEIYQSDKFDSSVVIESLLLKLSSAHHHQDTARSYQIRSVKFLEFDTPRVHTVVYFNVKHKECASLFPSGKFITQPFPLGGMPFYLSVHCHFDETKKQRCFGLYIRQHKSEAATVSVDYQISVRFRPEDFVKVVAGSHTFTPGWI